MKTKTIFTFILLLNSNLAFAAQCLKFDLQTQQSNILSPIKINEIIISKSSMVPGPDSIMLFMDYSDGGAIEEKHMFIECQKRMTKYFICESEEYNLSLDLSGAEPLMHLNYFILSDPDSPIQKLTTRNNQEISIYGQKTTCPIPTREQIAIEGE